MSVRWIRVGGLVAGLAGLLVSACSSGSAGGPSSPKSTASSPQSPSGSVATAGTVGSSPAGTPTASNVGPAGGPVPAAFRPDSATYVSSTEGWVLGTATCAQGRCTAVLRTRDGGASWRGIPAPSAPVDQPGQYRAGSVSTIRFADASDGWAAGSSLYATHDGGASWHATPLAPAGDAITALSTSGGTVYASVYGCPGQGSGHCSKTTVVYASPIGTDRWSRVSPTLHGGGSATLVTHGSDWYLPLPAGIYHGHGTSAPVTLPNPCPSFGEARPRADVAIADASHLDAMCFGQGAAGTAQYQLYGTTDGGLHWAKAGPAHLEPSGLDGIADNAHGVLIVAAASGDSEILRSTDDGVSLTHAAITAPSGGIQWVDLGFTTTLQALVVLPGSGLYLSRDAGRTWVQARL